MTIKRTTARIGRQLCQECDPSRDFLCPDHDGGAYDAGRNDDFAYADNPAAAKRRYTRALSAYLKRHPERRRRLKHIDFFPYVAFNPASLKLERSVGRGTFRVGTSEVRIQAVFPARGQPQLVCALVDGRNRTPAVAKDPESFFERTCRAEVGCGPAQVLLLALVQEGLYRPASLEADVRRIEAYLTQLAQQEVTR